MIKRLPRFFFVLRLSVILANALLIKETQMNQNSFNYGILVEGKCEATKQLFQDMTSKLNVFIKFTKMFYEVHSFDFNVLGKFKLSLKTFKCFSSKETRKIIKEDKI